MSASVNEREEPAPAWQKCEKHHITFGMARCPMCAEDDVGYSKSRSPLDHRRQEGARVVGASLMDEWLPCRRR